MKILNSYSSKKYHTFGLKELKSKGI